MRTAYTWICIAFTVIAAASGDVLIALAMRRIGDLGDFRRKHGFFPVIARVSPRLPSSVECSSWPWHFSATSSDSPGLTSA